MKLLKTVDDLLNVKDGSIIWHFNPYDAGNPTQVNLHQMTIDGVDKGQGKLYYKECGRKGLRCSYVSDMVGSTCGVKKTFTDYNEASKFLSDYHKGKQYPEVVEHHSSCRSF